MHGLMEVRIDFLGVMEKMVSCESSQYLVLVGFWAIFVEIGEEECAEVPSLTRHCRNLEDPPRR